jgi:hypothetical protein
LLVKPRLLIAAICFLLGGWAQHPPGWYSVATLTQARLLIV